MVRIVLIGLPGYSYKDDLTELISYSWNRLAAIKNLADFDQVLIFLPTLPSAKSLTRKTFEDVFSLTNMADILKGGRRFTIMGDPRIEVFPEDPAGAHGNIMQRIQYSAYLFTRWTWLGMQWDARQCTAQTTDYHDYHDRNAYDRYLSSLVSSEYSLKGLNPALQQIAEAFGLSEFLGANSNTELSIYQNPFCTSRYRTMIAGEVGFELLRIDPVFSRSLGMASHDVLDHFGSIVFLPETSLGHDEAIRILLEDAYGIQVETQEPEWAQQFLAPDQQAVDDQLDQLKAEAIALNTRWDELQEQRKSIRYVIRLLYGEHKDLEEAVRDAMRRMGADVEEPPEPNKRDGWITVTVDGEERHAVLEVKSKRKGEFDEQGLRQLDEWQSNGISEKGIAAKKVFVGNASPYLAPEDRDWPFGANFDKQTKLRNAVAFRSQDLFAVYQHVQNETLDPAKFWKNLFTKGGVLNLEELMS